MSNRNRTASWTVILNTEYGQRISHHHRCTMAEAVGQARRSANNIGIRHIELHRVERNFWGHWMGWVFYVILLALVAWEIGSRVAEL